MKPPIIAMLVASVLASAQEKGGFEPRPISSYTARQTSDKVTIAVEAFEDSEKLKQAFGKSDPSKYGILPVLVVLANDSARALQLDRMRVQFIAADQQAADPVPAEDVPRTGRVKPGIINPRPSPIPGVGRGSRRSKDEGEIAAREFAAPMIAPGERAHGFFYFRVAKGSVAGSKLYISGIRDARTAQELLYFEIPLDKR